MKQTEKEIQENLIREQNYQEYKKRKKKKGKAFPVILVFVVTIGILFFLYFSNNGEITNLTETNSNDKKYANEDFVMGLRLASIGRYDEAIEHFEKIKFNDLTDSDKYIVLNTYLENEQEQDALNLDNQFDVEVINRLVKTGKLEKLKELKTDSELVQFEIAVLENDYEKIIELKDADRLEKDERRANAIANAYYQLDQKEEAINFTSLMVFDGINMWNMETKVIDDTNHPTESTTSTNGNNFGSTLLFIVFLFILGVGGYFIYQNKNNFFKLPLDKKYKEVNNNENTNDDKENTNEEENIIEIKSEEINNTKNEKDTNDKYSYHYED